MRLSHSSRDSRCPWGRPWALTDLDDKGALVGSFKSRADVMKARVLLGSVAPVARGMSAGELYQLAGDISQTMYAAPPEKLSLPRFNALIVAMVTELRRRR